MTVILLFFLMRPQPPRSTLFPYTTLFRSNRVRVTCTGTLYMCLGQEDAADLRTPLRASEGNDLLHAAIEEAISRKPRSEEHTSELQSRGHLVCRLLLEKKKR